MPDLGVSSRYTPRYRRAVAADGPGFAYRPDLDGLRAVAILLVVAFHVGLPFVPGGFVGVDVFFVLSGFLITSLLWQEASRFDVVSLRDFYARRVRRLVPLASLVIVVTLVAAFFLWPAPALREVAAGGAASSVYGANLLFAFGATDYMSASSLPSPFLHFWSLAVEEQFYLLFPLLFVLVLRFRPSRSAMVWVLGAAAASSFVLSVWLTSSSPSWAFFGLQSRAWELLAGAVCALLAPYVSRAGWLVREACAGAGAGLLLVAAVRLDEATAYPGVWAVLPVAGTLLILVAGIGGGSVVGSVLSLTVMRRLGWWSYGWYLWHWPFLVVPAAFLGRDLSIVEGCVLAAAALGVAVVTFYLVERPVRALPSMVAFPGRSFVLACAAAAVGLAASFALWSAAPSRAVPLGPSASAPTSTVPVEDSSMELVSVVPSNLTPGLMEAKESLPAVYGRGCMTPWEEVTPRECVFGVESSSTTVVLFGDSHVINWFPAFERVALSRQWRLVVLTKTACPPTDVVIDSVALKRRYSECEQWRSQAIDRIAQLRPAAVVLSGHTDYLPRQRWREEVGSGWFSVLSKVSPHASAVVVLGDNARAYPDPVECLSRNLTSAQECVPERAVAVDAFVQAQVRDAALRAGAVYADSSEWMCWDEVCPVIVGNILVFRDGSHLTVPYALLATPQVDALMRRALPSL